MLWIKAFHIIAMVAWFAGLFYLPRLFVYHADIDQEPKAYARFCTMERRLYWGIMAPSALVTIFLGFGLLHPYGFQISAWPLWLSLKLSLVVFLILFHLYCGCIISQFKKGRNKHSSRFYRFLNEIPTLFLISIVLLVILKPN